MRTPALILACSILVACPAPVAPPDALAPFDCGDALVLEVRVPGGAYLPIADAADGAELVLGFQGFRYLYLRGHLDADPGPRAAAARIELDGGTVRSQPISELVFTADPAGGVISDPVQIFFNDDSLPSLVDHGCALELRLGDACVASGATVLRYDPSCVEGPDGQPICEGGPDAGVAAGGS